MTVVLTNATLVLPDQVMVGTVVLRAGRIVEVQPGQSATGQDLQGDHLIPGVVDVHTDNLERQVEPRVNARWPSRSAMLAHDAQCAAAGVTTVLDALCLGDLGFETARIETFRNGVADLDALHGTGLLKSDHYLHLRCELPAPDMKELVEDVADHPLVRMVSLMDHSPGAGQYTDMDKYRRMRARSGMRPEQIEARIAFLTEQRARLAEPQRRWLLDQFAGRGIALASHDDWDVERVRRDAAEGVGISEFPVNMPAAKAARDAGMAVIAGAPNIVRGGSHSGNVAAEALVRAGLVDALASDYVPASLIEAAFLCADRAGITLPAAIAKVTDAPARMAGLPDRGRIAPGLRADLVRVRVHEGLPVVREVWRDGTRVA
jgi:alpha-D-ribose 1-methylphosphonate 5-triphosphate diphosphatase